MTIHDAALHNFSQWWNRAIRSRIGSIRSWQGTRSGGKLDFYQPQTVRGLTCPGALLPLASIVRALAASPWWLRLWPGLTALPAPRVTLRDGFFAARLAVVRIYAETIGVLRLTVRTVRGAVGGTVNCK